MVNMFNITWKYEINKKKWKKFNRYMCAIQKRLTIAGLRPLAIARSATGCPLACICKLGFQEGFYYVLIRMVHRSKPVWVNNVVYAAHVHSFWRLEFYKLSREYLCDQCLIKLWVLSVYWASLADISCLLS